ncbi:MAG: glycerate kinase [Bacillales bacterium]|jgi:glycerate kinase|nr:glycerate kinase [Bacillales bacterium]
MKFVFSPDSFKGTLSSMDAINLLEKKAVEHFPVCTIVKVPIADGGEGTVESLVIGCNGTKVQVNVLGPNNNEVLAEYGIIHDDTAIIEMAQSSGLPLVVGEKNPLLTTSFGTGQVIKHAIEAGFRKLTIGIGGSATNDGGIGMLMALGVTFFDKNDQVIIDGIGENLEKISRIDISGIHSALKDCKIKVICDVTNPLLGDHGSTYVYGPQKGATSDQLLQLENGMKNFVQIVKKDLGLDLENIPGAGAAGGLGYALVTFLNAELVRGIDEVLNLVRFEELLNGASLVVTGEGNMDKQTALYGKVPVGVAERAKSANVPVIAIVGGLADDIDQVYESGISAIVPTATRAMPLNEVLENAHKYFEDAADRMFRMIKIGNGM